MPTPLPDASNQSFLKALWRLTRPYWFSEERWVGRGLLALVIALNLGDVATSVWYNSWNADFFNALQDKNEALFWHEMLLFCLLAAISIAIDVYRSYVPQLLYLRWRCWLPYRFLVQWLSRRTYYRMELTGRETDNPDQRLQEYLKNFPDQTLTLAAGFLNQATTLVSFLTILWRLSGAFSFSIAGASISIPGYMLWIALIYAGAGSWITQMIGRRLAALRFQQQRYEADFRFMLVRLRENAEGVALYGGEAEERASLWQRFAQILDNWHRIIGLTRRLYWFTYLYSQLPASFPLSSPRRTILPASSLSAC